MRWRSRLDRENLPFCSFDIRLKDLTTLGVGGPAECLARPVTRHDLSRVLDLCREEEIPAWFIGGGSNVLIPDEGLPGVTIQTGNLNGVLWEEQGDSVLLETESGVLLASLLALSMNKGWQGLEFSAGIPGTVGGALRGNAGVEGRSLGDLVESVLLVDDKGSFLWKRRQEISFSYRFSDLLVDNRAIVACRLALKKGDPASISSSVRGFIDRRKGQPRGVRTAGCIFKNPCGESAGRLLDETGCKGLQVGDAVVSSKHANFIENKGSASSKDIFRLISTCRERVFQRTGILLEMEICLMGAIPYGEAAG